MRLVLLTAAGLLALTACNRGDDQASSGSRRPTSTNAVTTAAAAMTQRREGLWEMTISTSAGPGMEMTGQMCLDKERAAKFDVQPTDANQNCTASKLRPTAGGWTFSSTCKMGDRTVISEGVVKGDLSRTYTIEAKSRMEPAVESMPEGMETKVNARWLGACQPGQEPGKFAMKGMNMGG